MKNIQRIIVLCTVFFLSTGLLLVSVAPASAEELKDCELQLKPGESIPSSFPVGKCLKLDDQRNRVPTGEETPGAPSGVVKIIVDAVDLLVKIIATLALLIFMLGALLAITSEGKEDRLEKGKTAMLYSLIGLAIAMMSFAIVTFVQSILF